MNTVVVATTAADSAAVEAVKNHHAELAGALSAQVEAVISAAVQADSAAAGAARHALVSWCEKELVPHALAEEKTIYLRAHEDSRAKLLVDSMLAEHQVIIDLVAAVREAPSPVHAAADAQALRVLFASHLTKENEQVLPLLAASTDVSLADLLGGMHELLGGGRQDESEAHGGQGAHAGACTCGEKDPAGFPELDARVVPHAIRHATIFGALDSVKPGGGLVLVAPHDPLPLLAQIQDRYDGVFAIDYLERGPEAWRLSFARS